MSSVPFFRAPRTTLAVLASVSLAIVSWANSDVTVKSATYNKGGRYVGTNPKVFTPTKATALATTGGIRSYLNLGRTVVVTTASAQLGNGNLTVSSEIAKTSLKTATLELQAEKDLLISKPIRATRKPLSLVLKAQGNIAVNALITTKGGDFTVGSGVLAAGAGGAGELIVDGNAVLGADSALAVKLGSAAKFGKLTATGAVTLSGALKLDCIDGFEDLIASGNSFTIVKGASVTGTFAGITNGGRVFLPDDLGSLKVTYTASSVVLSDWQPIITDLAWDPGTEDAGTEVHTNARARGRRHYFRVHTEDTDIGAWRTRLTPDLTGEADLYMRRGSLPTTLSYDYKSARVGADGFVLNTKQFSAGQEWFIFVNADPGKAWALLSGRPYVQDLGTLPWTDLNNDGSYQIGEPPLAFESGASLIGGEGMRFYSATLPAGTPAWSLWLKGANKSIAVKRAGVPFHTSNDLYDRKQTGRMLVVPPVLTGEVATHFVSVVGNPGEEVNLDSRIQEVTDTDFNATVENVSVNDTPYRVYRVQVPVDQIAWDVSAVPLTGNANIAIRRDVVAGEYDNDAFSEVPGTAQDSITVVPDFLTDGAWYITVYGDSPYSFTLRNGPPDITPIAFTDSKLNDQTLRAGWRFYALTDIPSQLGAYGWILELANQVSGTEIALRRNAVPSRWRNRKNGDSTIVENSVVEFSGKTGFLERPAHQPDVWYVGIYMPTEPLGAFTLSTRPITPLTIAFDGGSQAVQNLEPGRWAFVHVTVPDGVQGWDARLRNVTGATPTMAVRHDLLPEMVTPPTLTNLPNGWQSSKNSDWPTGNQWKGTVDWTGYTLESNGAAAATGVVSAMGRPLEAGNYYVGVLNTGTEKSSFTIDSRGIGDGQYYPIANLAYNGGTATITDLPAREARYFKVTIPPNTPSWEVVVDATVGDVELAGRWDNIPDFNTGPTYSVYHWMDHMGEETEIKKVGNERYVLLPNGGGTITGSQPRDFYLEVISEGVNPSGSKIGTGASSAVIRSNGLLPITEMGGATEAGIQQQVSLVAGQIKAFQFEVPPDTHGLEVRLLTPAGSPVLTVIDGADLPAPKIPSEHGVYGLDGGILSVSSTDLITASNPTEGVWSVLVNAPPTSDATATLSVVARGVLPVAFNGGTSVVTDQLPGTWRYFVINVPNGAAGWDFRVKNPSDKGGRLMIRRDYAPSLVDNQPSMIPTSWRPCADVQWPSTYQWLGGVDWSNYSYNPGSIPVPDRLVAAMGRPLEPGTYYAGIYNSSSANISYTVDSRGIGPDLAYPVTDLDYAGGTSAISGLAPREARYFRVTVPQNSPSWEVVLTPTVGEAELLVRNGAIPDFQATQSGSIYQATSGNEVEMQKSGQDRYVLLPDKGQQFIPPGDYYIAVVSEGQNPTTGVVGAGTCEAQLTSVGPLAIKQLGIPTPEGVTEAVNLAAGQIRAYQITVQPHTQSLEVRLNNPVGNPQISLVSGETLPKPAAFGTNGNYGWNSGDIGTTHNSVITVANPAEGTWSILVRGGQASGQPFGPSSADLVVTALSTVPLDYDGGSFTVTNQPPASWRYFTVEVPAGVLGWDIRLRDVSGVTPAFLVRRDQVPFVTPNTSPANYPGWTPSASASWATGNQWLGRVDWTDYLSSPGLSPQGLVAAMGHPLEPGTYYIGIFNNKTAATGYTIVSQGIGAGRHYEVTDLAFDGGSEAITDLPPREPKYFKVTIPDGMRSWEVTVDPTVGDLQMAARFGCVPDFFAPAQGNIYTSAQQLKIRKAGAERYVLLPNNDTELIPPGDYYLAVISDGVNPDRLNSVVGTGTSSGTITSHGLLEITDLGAATVDGASTTVNLVSTQTKAYKIDVPVGTETLEVRLDNKVGFPEFVAESSTRLLVPPAISYYGGVNGGKNGTLVDGIRAVINPTPGPWYIMVRATEAGFGAPDQFPDASATLVVRQKPNIPLNFDSAQNAQGGTNADDRTAIDTEQNVYKVTPPSTLNGEPVLGWVIHTDVSQGSVKVKVFKDFTNPNTGVERPGGGDMVVVPPYLTFDQPWYVRVLATGATQYRITCRAVTLERPVWSMPEPHNITFGDSGNDAQGNPLPGDRGVDLKQSSWHFYAVDVPENNRGLLRTELRAISGNPDLYIREDGVPTTDHNALGTGGASLVNRSLGGATTSYGNWVPLSGRTETRLRPGRWYLGVRASDTSNVRYRLIVSSGNVREMALDPSSATAQIPSSVTGDVLADNDWRYYRFVVPETAPANWKLTFSQTVGDVVMRVRDSIPPGQKKQNTTAAADLADASTDIKNQGPYTAGYNLAGTYTLTTPPLRPGQVYYVGFRSNNSATFSFSSQTAGQIDLAPALDFYTGTVNTSIPANSSLMYRIPVPIEGTRFKYTSVHSSSVKVRIEQGTLAVASGSQHFDSSVDSTLTNSSANEALSLTDWPWQPGQTYYVLFVNSSTSPQNIQFVLAGKNAQTEDEDNDGLLDAWERQYFGNITSQNASGDADGDGVSNAVEFADGTAPNDASSAKYPLTLSARNGTVTATPSLAKYDLGSVVQLSSVSAPGYDFVGWVGTPLRTDDYAIKATATVTIPTGGTWTFGVYNGDGARLIINGTTVLSDNLSSSPSANFGQINLPAGSYPLELVSFERSGGESLELFAAQGSYTSIQPQFRLVGDTANGGLAVSSMINGTVTPEFLVRQVATLTTTVPSLTSADSLLASTASGRIEVTGAINTINFLDYSMYQGYFADDAHFPLTSAVEDQPFELTIGGAYTMTALYSLPLGVGTDAEGLVWETGGNAPWLAENDATAFDGVDFAGSGPIGDNQSSVMQATVQGPGTLTFRWRLWSQAGDNMVLALDGATKATLSGNSNDSGWLQQSVTIPTGTHRVTWTYSKNASGSAGNDRGYVDQVTFGP